MVYNDDTLLSFHALAEQTEAFTSNVLFSYMI